MSFKKLLAIFSGPVIFLIIRSLNLPGSIQPEAQSVLAITAWIAVWWITEAIPIPATSLLPIILFPTTKTLSIEETTAAYGHKMVFLYMGGFVIALAIEKWNLHKRIALQTIYWIGGNTDGIILGFMVSTFLLSMWISNTATTLMMLPIALAVARHFGRREDSEEPSAEETQFGLPLMLGIAYAASIGGISTLIGTPTNAMLSAVVKDIFKAEIDFAKWMSLALPIAILLLFICWLYLTKIVYPAQKKHDSNSHKEILRELKNLGRMTTDEKKVIVVFALIALSWILRSFLLAKVIPGIDDTIIAIFGAIILFLIPSSKSGEFIMDWRTARKLPWGILILFGGGLAIASAFQSSGLAVWMGSGLKDIGHIQLIFVILIVATMVNFLTEVTSNVATASILLPILASVATAIGFHPYSLMIVATLSASCAFMLPVATPPNAIVFSSGYISIRQMARAGFGMNLLSIVIITLLVLFLMPLIWGINITAP